MGLFGNAEAKAQKRADRRAARTERVAKRREFLGGVIDKAAGVAGMFAPGEGGGGAPGTKEGGTDSTTTTGGLPKWVVPAAIGGVLLFMFMGKKRGR